MDRWGPDELTRLRAGDPDVFGRLYRESERAVLAFFVRQVRDPEVAADLCAETFAQALLSLRRYDPDRGRPIQWLFGIARHQLIRHARRGSVDRRAREALGLLEVKATRAQLDAIAALEGEIDVEVLLQDLPASQSAAVRARVLDDQSYGEIAARQGASEQAIRQRVSRGLTAIRSRVEGSRR